MAVNHLQCVFDQATTFERNEGLVAYEKYKELTSRIANDTGFDSDTGHAVFAALSPNNDYHGNLRDCRRLLSGVATGLKHDQVRCSTYNQNKLKAWRIANGSRPLSELLGTKTRSFYQNIANPSDPYPVTVDGHMVNCWRGITVPLRQVKMNDRVYADVAREIRVLARHVGIVSSACQAIIWYTHRRLTGNMSTVQSEFWDADSLAAGLGFFPCS